MASPGTKPGTIRFGPFELDPVNRELRKRGYVVRLQPQQFTVLHLFVERAGQIVSREEIRQHIWGDDTFVDFERGINFSINQIRAALGDDADKPRFIETIPRRGYRFICPLEIAEPEPVQPETNAPQLVGQAQIKTDELRRDTPGKFGIWLLASLGFAMLMVTAGVFIRGHYTLRPHWPWIVKARSAAVRAHTIALTNVRGLVYSPAFSPDGKQIAFFWNGPDQNKIDIYVQMIGGDQPLRLTYSGTRRICCMNWSSDGQRISFARCDNDVGAVYTVPVLGGPERKLTDVTCMEFDLGTPAWTPDGRSVLMIDRCVPNGPYGIVAFSLETGLKHCVTAPPSTNATDAGFKLSPDGRNVAFLRNSTPGVNEIYIVPVTGGTPRQLTADGQRILAIMWAADGKRIIFLSRRGGFLSDRLWQVSVEGSEIQPEIIYPHIGSLSPDGQRVAYFVEEGGEPYSVWRADVAAPGGHVLEQKKILASAIYDAQPQLSPDGMRIAFLSARSGNGEIWASDADGSNPVQITSFGGENVGTPRWSPDSKWIVFDRRPGKHSEIYVMDAEGRNMRPVTSGDYDNSVPSWSRDGQSIYFGSMRTGGWQLWKQSIVGGAPVQVTQHGGFTAFESYDGKTLYYSKVDGEGLWRTSPNGGTETLVTPALRLGFWGAWAVTESGIYLLDNDTLPRPTIEFYDFTTRKLSPVIHLKLSALQWDPSFDASRDGRLVLFVQHQQQSSIAMVEDFQ